MNHNPAFAMFGLAAMAVLAILSIAWHYRRSDSVLTTWAARNGFRILDQDYRWCWKGPFWWRCSQGQTVYRVRVEDREGRVRTGWVRCGGWMFGLLTDDVAVEWED